MDTRSVTLAAERLGKTPSAVSHGLGRLREQVGDPLMVKVAGRMQPSPFAEQLIEDVRPILRAIQRVVKPPRLFDPATSDRVFRLAIPSASSIVSEVSARVNAHAPGVSLEWVSASRKNFADVVDEQIDLALVGLPRTLPEGITAGRWRQRNAILLCATGIRHQKIGGCKRG